MTEQFDFKEKQWMEEEAAIHCRPCRNCETLMYSATDVWDKRVGGGGGGLVRTRPNS